ncbi:hypothetical protein TeGR_g12559 [Tetraparma gracilis]|uniref:Uncharacterized protein n=1 Tax=Tetraparma gracilis TaxID=2962635 RepID=A0ABQ6N370_9STRA|nr:hypothetical protein TeGR_g12559 [Tetraparma gracilis]
MAALVFLLMLGVAEAQPSDITSYPACVSTAGDENGEFSCHFNENLINLGPTAKNADGELVAQFFCASECLSWEGDTCYLTAINDPSICMNCDERGPNAGGVCQPCCRCWDEGRYDNPFVNADREASVKCIDVCRGYEVDSSSRSWNDCEYYLGGAGTARAGLLATAGAALLSAALL